MCIELDPKKRPNAKDLLNHEFFSDFKEMGSFATLDVSNLYDTKIDTILSKV